MEDFIYIILAVVWLVISIWGGKKKKQAQQAKPTSSEPQPYEGEPTSAPQGKTEIEDMLEDFFGPNTKTKKPQDAPQPRYYQEEEEYSFNQDEVHHESVETIEDNEYKRYETKYSVGKDYEFSAEGKVETLEDLIRQYKMSDEKAEEEDAKLNVVDLNIDEAITSDYEFDARKAIIYSEIINRKYV